METMKSNQNFDGEDFESSDKPDKERCFPCSLDGKVNPANAYCIECEEYLCETCTEKHKNRKASKNHVPMGLQEYKKMVDSNTYICTVCKDEGSGKIIAESSCIICKEDLCKHCSDEHRRRKATKHHTLSPISDKVKLELELSNSLCTNCSEDSKNIKAEFYCAECEENLCTLCTKKHGVRTATKNHDLSDIKDLLKQKPICQLTCDLCAGETLLPAENCCDQCGEYMCTDCSRKHKSRNATKSHQTMTIILNENFLCAHCKKLEENRISAFYCSVCFNHLCQTCARKHISTQETESHVLLITQTLLEKTKNTKQCTICKTNKQDRIAVSFCNDCNVTLCDLCFTEHKSKQLNKDHIVENLELGDFDRLKEATQKTVCDKCQNENAVMICIDCKGNLCETCKEIHKHRVTNLGDSRSLKEEAYKDNFPAINAPVELAASSNTITLSWEIPYSSQLRLKGFDLRFRIAIVQGLWKTQFLEQITDNYTITELLPGTPYEFQVRAVYEQNGEKVYGSFSAPSSHILTKQITPGKPKAVETLGDKITIEWDIPVDDNTIQYYEIRHRKIGDTKWHVTSTDDSAQKATIDGLQGNTTYEFKVRPVFGTEEGPYGPVSDQITTKTPNPGKPQCINTATDSIVIAWERPESGKLLIKHYEIRYRMVGHDKWNTVLTKDDSTHFKITDLNGSSKYEFQIRAVYEQFESPYGPTSDQIETEVTLARKLTQVPTVQTKELQKGQSGILYKVPITLDKDSVNEKAKFRRCIFGNESENVLREKTIMLVGATGSGKSTLIDGMMNYILDVNWEDEFRFSLIDLTKEEKEKCGDQTLSQTEWITCYRINHTNGAQIYYTLNIIDTPGFGDTRGITKDRTIVDQMRELFSTKGSRGISTIDGVCFVTQAPLGRLSPTQKYIFESILSVFGKNIEKNIFILITFADGNTPPVLSALDAANIPFVEKFVFNNSALFASRNGDFAHMFWNMGKESFQKFFGYLNGTKTRSLLMTADVLNERNKLEGTVQGLRPKINEGLNKLETIRQTRQILMQHKTDIEANRNFEYEVEETHQRKIDLKCGEYTTNCLICNRTCHHPCFIPNDEDKSKCAVMNDGKCNICESQCKWDSHKNNTYIFETYKKR